MQQAGTSNKSWGLSGINYISLPEGICGIAKQWHRPARAAAAANGEASGETNLFSLH